MVGWCSLAFPHSLRPLDVEFMRALHQRVNIVPVLAKADTLTPAEVERMKNKVRGGWHSLKPSQWVPGDGGALGLGSLLGWGLSPTPAWTLPWSILRAHSTVEDHCPCGHQGHVSLVLS